jgi:hypothetical protein
MSVWQGDPSEGGGLPVFSNDSLNTHEEHSGLETRTASTEIMRNEYATFGVSCSMQQR